MSSDLATFVAARLDEDDARLPLLAHTTRMWRELDAKRALLAEHSVVADVRAAAEGHGCRACLTDRHDKYPDEWYPDAWPCRTVRLLAAIWSNHPDYDQEWKP